MSQQPALPRRHDEPTDSDDLFRRMAAAPPGQERNALRQQLIMAWMPMAERLATRYRDRGESLDDLRQVAALGLVKAVSRYDPARGHAFASYAVPTIDGELKRHFRDHLWSVHVPRGIQELRAKVRVASQELGTTTALAEIAARTGLCEEQVKAGLSALTGYAALSLDAPLDAEHGGPLVETMGASDPAYDAVLDRESVKPRLRALPRRERMILFMRYFEDMKQSEIAEVLGISQMHVSRLLRNTCAQLRNAVMENSRTA
jgi:RNA polymerase sigma-B factor